MYLKKKYKKIVDAIAHWLVRNNEYRINIYPKYIQNKDLSQKIHEDSRCNSALTCAK